MQSPVSQGPASRPPAARWEQILGRATDDARQRLAQSATLRARELGLAVVRGDGDVDIPLTLTPEIIEPVVSARRAADAADVLSSVVKMARVVLSGGVESEWSKRLFGHFGPLELACLARWREAEDVTIARIDWFLDRGGRHYALESNTTIPAMQAYSDAAARAWIETMAGLAGFDSRTTEGLVAENGSNAEELRRSIVAHAGLVPSALPSIAIVHRDSDSQLRELQALAKHFASCGHEVRLCSDSEIEIGSDGRATAGAFVPDILYRHIFARRMKPGSPLERIARGESKSRLQNPINGQLEVKGLFAELSRSVAEDGGKAAGLNPSEVETVRNRVPWTRLLATGPAISADGQKIADLTDYVRSNGANLVLKKSWDYGGKNVHIGVDVVEAEGAAGWRKRVDEALKDAPASWVVQTLVSSPRRRHLVVDGGKDARWEDVYVDASSYCATGDRSVPGGGVARFARSGVVNIVGGGGVAPLISVAVAERIAKAIPRSGALSLGAR